MEEEGLYQASLHGVHNSVSPADKFDLQVNLLCKQIKGGRSCSLQALMASQQTGLS